MIETIKHNGSNSLGGYFWRRWKQFRLERRTIRAGASHSLEGIRLSLEGLSPRLKYAIVGASYERAETLIARQLLRKGDRILELGSAIGFLGLFCLIVMKAAKVVSVEPNPETLAYLRTNYAMNQQTPEIIAAAVSANDGTMELNMGEDFWEDSLAPRAEHRRRIAVRTLSLHSLLRASQLSCNCLIVDVEGAETQISWEAVPVHVEKIIIELHPELVGYSASYRVLNQIQNLGFEVNCRVEDVYGLKRPFRFTA